MHDSFKGIGDNLKVETNERFAAFASVPTFPSYIIMGHRADFEPCWTCQNPSACGGQPSDLPFRSMSVGSLRFGKARRPMRGDLFIPILTDYGSLDVTISEPRTSDVKVHIKRTADEGFG